MLKFKHKKDKFRNLFRFLEIRAAIISHEFLPSAGSRFKLEPPRFRSSKLRNLPNSYYGVVVIQVTRTTADFQGKIAQLSPR